MGKEKQQKPPVVVVFRDIDGFHFDCHACGKTHCHPFYRNKDIPHIVGCDTRIANFITREFSEPQ